MVLFQNYILLLLVVFIGPVNRQTSEITIKISIPETVIIGETFKVSATISKGNLNGFAKVQLNFPAGFIPEPIETENAKFLFENKTVKFIWDRLPIQPEIILKMNVNTSKVSEGIKGISGIFAYLDGTVKKEKRIQNTVFRLKFPIVASDLHIEASESAHDKIYSADNPVQKSKIEFRIQIAAASHSIDKKVLAFKFNIDKHIMEETHNGMLKYTIGPYSTYPKAREQQAYYRINRGVKGAFITTYKNGKRIPINEAIRRTK